MKHSEIRKAYAQHSTFLIGAASWDIPDYALRTQSEVLVQNFLYLTDMGRDSI
ncbi:hypothetical protein [Legionella bononiensis]|uniref:Uncharacterized protein n=1 Tax=Legionella bononiensis TaxID=2793102 RepID=A0ABS1WBL8_9GAMM|nr:hypothetical protein [Legionella bononiensis]MBL7526749.1 hypothetical protein [Legionella bononiensis]